MKKITKLLVAGACAAVLAASCLALAGCGSSTASNNAASNTNAAAANNTAAANTNTAKADANGYILLNEGKVIVGSDLDYPPMEYLDANGNPTGFSYAMSQELAKRLGIEFEWLPPQNFDGLVAQVAAGTTMDIGISSFTITDERAELIDFTDSYYDSNQAIVVRKADVDTIDLKSSDLKVAAQSGTSGEDWIAENLPNATYTPFTATTDAVTALVAGQVDAVVYDQPVAEAHVKGQFANDCAVKDVIATGEQYGIIVNKANTKLTEDLNKALAEMEADGTMQKLRDEYLG